MSITSLTPFYKTFGSKLSETAHFSSNLTFSLLKSHENCHRYFYCRACNKNIPAQTNILKSRQGGGRAVAADQRCVPSPPPPSLPPSHSLLCPALRSHLPNSRWSVRSLLSADFQIFFSLKKNNVNRFLNPILTRFVEFELFSSPTELFSSLVGAP